MSTRDPLEFWTWRRWPEEAPPPDGLDVRAMVHGVGRLEPVTADEAGGFAQLAERARADAESYVGRLTTRIEESEQWPDRVVICLQTWADNPREGVLIDELVPYWAITATRIVGLLSDWYASIRLPGPRGIVVHAEDRREEDGSVGSRFDRDSLIEVMLGAPLRRAFPRAILTGYGIQSAASIMRSVTSYGTPAEVARAYAEHMFAPGDVIPWIPRARFIRHSPALRREPVQDRIVRPIDVAMYASFAAWSKAPAAILWGDDNASTVEAWRDTWHGLGVLLDAPQPAMAVGIPVEGEVS